MTVCHGMECSISLLFEYPGDRYKLCRIIGSLLLGALIILGVARADGPSSDTVPSVDSKSIRALLITGGGYHDYNAQTKILTEGISARANVEWAVFHENGNRSPSDTVSSKALKDFFDNPDWSKGYDVVVYNDCYTKLRDRDLMSKMIAPHKAGLPAVILHGAIHNFEFAKYPDWYEFVGMESPGHKKAQDFTVINLAPDNPITSGLPAAWTLPKREEVYEMNKMFLTATALAKAHDANTNSDCNVIWTNLYGPARTRVFATSLFHRNSMMSDPVYLDLVTRGLLWSIGKLDASVPQSAKLFPAKQVMLDDSTPESTFKDQTGYMVHD